ncbi:hypothetical protein QOZ80_3AG0232530 [Eleusine coracana subsp. coracana]|nr:hypothetical protein QOZ80_3AG0232530 [Eleusine coracana subsp. coracana]
MEPSKARRHEDDDVATHQREGKDAMDPSCVVVLFHLEEPDMWCCRVDGSGDGWRRYTYDIGDYELPEGYRSPPSPRVMSSVAAVQGKLYFIASSEEMGVIDFSSEDPDFQYFDVAMVDFPQGMCSGVTWLVESQDDLLLVCICFVAFDASDIGAIRVHRMDLSEACWRPVHDIGDFLFLLEDTNMAASCAATPLGLKGNRIYFMNNFQEDDADLRIIDLETQDARQDIIIQLV